MRISVCASLTDIMPTLFMAIDCPSDFFILIFSNSKMLALPICIFDKFSLRSLKAFNMFSSTFFISTSTPRELPNRYFGSCCGFNDLVLEPNSLSEWPERSDSSIIGSFTFPSDLAQRSSILLETTK